MKDKSEPITTDELVIRLIWKTYYDPNLILPIQPGAFSPKNNETDGISVFRAGCVKNPEDTLVVFAEDKRDKYAIALLALSDLIGLGLTVQAAKIDDVRGHSILPELNIVDWKADKARLRGIQKQWRQWQTLASSEFPLSMEIEDRTTAAFS